MLARQEAIILSMTKNERIHPKLINGSRRARIAKGAGVQVQDVNKLLKQQQQMRAYDEKIQKTRPKRPDARRLAELAGILNYSLSTCTIAWVNFPNSSGAITNGGMI